MSSGEGKPHAEMLALALEVAGLIGGACDRVAIAGSLRRMKPVVKDIELVVQPSYRPVWNGLWNELDAWCETLLKRGTLQKRLNARGHTIAWGKEWTTAERNGDEMPPPGSRFKAAIYKGVPVDIFIVLRDRQFAPTLLIRTGPNEANQALVTPSGVVNQNGIRGVLPSGMRFDEGAVWQDGRKLDTPTERSVFAACGLPYVSPHLRTMEIYQQWAARRWAREAMISAQWKPHVVTWGWTELPWVVNVPRRYAFEQPGEVVQQRLFEGGRLFA